ncbi:MAG: cysteine desulfurase family protein [Pleomorphochaeta sp.]
MIYADNAATTKMSNEALKVLNDYLLDNYGNPSSSHLLGRRAKDALVKAREIVAKEINCFPSEILFTSGGSESITQAILSAAAWGKQNDKMHIISSKIEHKAALNVLRSLENEGFKVDYILPDNKGVIRVEDIKESINDKTALVNIMYVNNEIGSIQPIDEIGCICCEYGALFHSDCVQAITHLDLDVKRSKLSFASFSAHKFHGPKGVGFLYYNKGLALKSIVYGGSQERGYRGGTENVASILAMAEALRFENSNRTKNLEYIKKLNQNLENKLLTIEGSFLNGGKNNRIPTIINIGFKGVLAEDLLLILDKKKIFISAGSACTSGSIEPSHVLLSLGLNKAEANNSIRISLSRFNEEKEIDEIYNSIVEAVNLLRSYN